jgi:hypothetical protein
MRRFPFFVAPLVGIVALFFLFKLLMTAVVGLVIFGGAFMLIRKLAMGRRMHPMHVAAMRHRQPVPIDPRRSEPAFDWMPQGRIIEVV